MKYKKILLTRQTDGAIISATYKKGGYCKCKASFQSFFVSIQDSDECHDVDL